MTDPIEEAFAYLDARVSVPAVTSSLDQAKKAYDDLVHLAVHAQEAARDDDKGAFLSAVVTAANLTDQLDRGQLLMIVGYATADLAEVVIREGRHVRVEVDPDTGEERP